MKKGLIIVLAIVILGLLALYFGNDGILSNSPSTSGSVSSSKNTTSYKDGSYIGNKAETLYGNVQIKIIVSNGKIVDVQFIEMPYSDDGRTQQLTDMSKPLLKDATLRAQSDQIDFVSGATSTSYGYQESLQAALDRATGSSILVPKQNTG